MKIAALIPARKGSKRIKNKNRLSIDGDPLIEIIINTLNETNFFDEIYLSTDDQFLEKKYKSKLNILNRTEELSDDHSTAIDLLKHHQSNELKEFDIICLIFIHAINISSKDILSAINTLKSSSCKRLMTICKLPVPLEWTYKLKDKSLDPNFKDAELIRSQDLEQSYFDAGQFYLYKASWFDKCELVNIAWHELTLLQSVDLDEPKDLELLELFYKINKQQKKSL